MTYKLKFHAKAEKEWRKLDADTRTQFARKLVERQENPRVPHDALHGMRDCYKIKLRTKGYRLVYRVEDETITVFVLAVGKRENDDVYEEMEKRH